MQCWPDLWIFKISFNPKSSIEERKKKNPFKTLSYLIYVLSMQADAFAKKLGYAAALRAGLVKLQVIYPQLPSFFEILPFFNSQGVLSLRWWIYISTKTSLYLKYPFPTVYLCCQFLFIEFALCLFLHGKVPPEFLFCLLLVMDCWLQQLLACLQACHGPQIDLDQINMWAGHTNQTPL